ncbi:chromate efflux transporter [Flavobacterium degerlachei]|jgi:chromate transporter|uniref:Chromate transporter n=1 Tax=Flavobacterium degerlachei TaxID=229203 RepID=A0A1H2YEB9_9FLAO|nr:chromate efflux transporter [Flavobacterium degerlachei]SDX03168.1 chromate transporter [Flavobacterium degerlachei]
MSDKNSLKEIAKLFLKLGIIGFGGPAAHIAMMRQEVVIKKKWLSEQHFLDLIGATSLIPGPNSTEMAIHIGHEKGGWRGLIVAGVCFIMPAVLITGVFAYFYKIYGQQPEAQVFLYGIKPAIIAIILAAIYPLAKKSIKTTQLAIISLVALALSILKFNEIYILFGAGLIALLYSKLKSGQPFSLIPLTLVQVTKTTLVTATNWNLFLIFLKIGAILYGSGYVLFAFLDTELVSTGLMSRATLADAIAIGQFTPGPVFSSVTFIGYQLNGLQGAIVATIAIFIPSFLFVALLNPLVKKMRNSPSISVFLDAVNVASVAIIVAICWQMGRDSIFDWRTALIAITSIVVTFGYPKVNSAFIVIYGAAAGYFLSFLG